MKKIDDFPNFGINKIGCSDEDLEKILNILEEYKPLRFNGCHTHIDFINNRDTQGRAWCWTVSYDYPKLNLSGVHTRDWFREDLMNHMIGWDDFIRLGLEKSINKMKLEVKNRENAKKARKFKLI